MIHPKKRWSDRWPAPAENAPHAHVHGDEESDGLEWEDLMPDINRRTDPSNMIWRLIDRADGGENHSIQWRFTVGDRVKIIDILLYVTNPGLWMAHCHIAEHTESGMRFSFYVDPKKSTSTRRSLSEEDVENPTTTSLAV